MIGSDNLKNRKMDFERLVANYVDRMLPAGRAVPLHSGCLSPWFFVPDVSLGRRYGRRAGSPSLFRVLIDVFPVCLCVCGVLHDFLVLVCAGVSSDRRWLRTLIFPLWYCGVEFGLARAEAGLLL